MNDNLLDEVFDLVEQLSTDRLDEGGAHRLHELVLTDATARAEYVRLMDAHGRLVWSLRGMPAADASSLVQLPPTQSQPTSPVLTRLVSPLRYLTRPVLGSIALVALTFYGVFALLAWNLRSHDRMATSSGLESALVIEDQTTFTAQANSASSENVARMTDGISCVWQLIAGQTEPQVGAKLTVAEPLELVSGVAEFTFADGAKVLLQGPTTINLLAANRAQLHAGSLVAHIPPRAVGFTVDTPSITLVDRGTEFGVTVDPVGQTDVQVFTGAVDISYRSHLDTPNAKRRTLRMTAGKAKHFGNRAGGPGVAVTEVAPWFEAAAAQDWLAGHGKLLPPETKYASAVLADHPIAYWRLSDRGNRIAADASGNGVRAEYHGIVETNNPGISPGTSDRSVRFRGTNLSGWLQIDDLELPASFTLELWARSASPEWNTYGWLLASQTPPRLLFHSEKGSRGWRFLVTDADRNYRTVSTHVPEKIDDRLHHYVGAYDSVTDRGLMYFDGALVAEAAQLLGNTRRTEPVKTTIDVGRDIVGGTERYGEGWVDEVAVYDRALSLDAVLNHYRAATDVASSLNEELDTEK